MPSAAGSRVLRRPIIDTWNIILMLIILTNDNPHGGTVAEDGSDDDQAEHEVVQDGGEHVHGGHNTLSVSGVWSMIDTLSPVSGVRLIYSWKRRVGNE